MGRHDLQDSIYCTLSPLLVGAELRIRSGGCGLFGDFFMALDGLLFCARSGIAGRPYWDRRSLYFDPARGRNAWNYFFQPIEYGRRCLALPYFPSARHFHAQDGHSGRRVAAAAVARFGQIRPDLVAIARRFIDDRLCYGDYVGVHVRGTDARAAFEGRTMSDLAITDQALEEALSGHPERVIFLATDEQSVVESFRARWGARVRYRPCTRSTDGRSVHGHYDGGQGGSGYQKGVEVVLDALLLAWGKHLVRGHSRVTMYSLALNPDLPFSDVDILRGEKPRAPWLYD